MSKTKSRLGFSVADRKLLCELKERHSDWSNTDVARVASKQLGRDVSRASVHKTLKDKEKWLTCTTNLTRMKDRKPKWEDLDAGLLQYYKEEEERSTKPVPGPKLVARAKELATELHIEDFKCSAGWLNNFKRRHSLLKATAGRSDSRADAELLASLKDQIEESHREAGSSKKQKLDDSLAVPEAGPSKTFQGLLQDEEPLPGQIVVTEDDNDMLISQREAVDSAKILLAYFSERPSLGYEHQKAMRKIAAAIMRHKQ